MLFNYSITKEVGRGSYSERLDDMCYDTEDYDWEYEVDDKDIVEALIDMIPGWTASAKKSVIEILDYMLDGSQRKDILAELEVSSYEEAYEKVKKELNISAVKEVQDKKFVVYKILDYILGDISYYAEVMEDELKEYFRDEAEEDFDDNN